MFPYTIEEKKEVLNRFFVSEKPLVMKKYPKSFKKRYLALLWIAEAIEANRDYTEQEINGLLSPIYHDYVLIRRELFDYKLIHRLIDGSKYWHEVSK